MLLWHRYAAQYIGDESHPDASVNDYAIIRRGWFGLGPPEHRVARWDGYWYGGGSKPDFAYLAADGSNSIQEAKGGARRALIRAHKIRKKMLPAPWSVLPPARLLQR